jgi:NDP-sugar pyrophosphorylase family protein
MARLPVLIILAGGASSRLWPLREKSLMRFGTEPLLVSQLQAFRKLGFDRAVIVGNPDNLAEIAAYTTTIAKQMRLEVIVQEEPLGMGDALLQVESVLSDMPETPVYVNQVHDVVDQDLHQVMLQAYQRNPATSYLAGVEMKDYFPGGYMVVAADRQIAGIVEKPGPENRPSNLVSIVAHIHANAAALFEALRAEYATNAATDDHYERAMDRLMQTHVFRAVPYKGFWAALKYPWHVLDIMEYFLNKIDGQVVADDAFIAPNATLAGNIYIGSGARVFPGAAIVGPAFIGAGTIVGNNSLVRNSMVLANCEIGFTTEVARSYVASNCSLHACRVLDSVFAQRINFSAGCTTANLRMDRGTVSSMVKEQKLDTGRQKLGAIIGEGAFLAVDVMTMPGVKVGENAQVGPGTHVQNDVLDGQRVYVRQHIQVVDDGV